MAKRTGGFIGQDGLNAPDQATGVTGTAGDAQVEVSFTAPTDVGGAAITGYRVQDSTGAFGASGSSSPVTVAGLTNGTSYTFNVWAINPFGWSSPSDASGSVNPFSSRGVFAGGIESSLVNTIEFVQIPTLGNVTDFGDLTAAKEQLSGLGSSTRGVYVGGNTGSTTNVIEYITFASAGNGIDFGNIHTAKEGVGTLSNDTRGLYAGGNTSNDNIEFITIANTGNGTDFGDLSQGRMQMNAAASPTRGIFAGGSAGTGGSSLNKIDYVTIGSTGNAIDFGDLTVGRNRTNGGCSSGTRAVFGGGFDDNTNTSKNTIDYVTIASTGNATDFGDLLAARQFLTSCSSNVRGLFGGGQTTNQIQYITIATTGSATDFGDLSASRRELASASNSHGGIS